MSAFSKDVEFRGSIWISHRDEIFSNRVLLFLCTHVFIVCLFFVFLLPYYYEWLVNIFKKIVFICPNCLPKPRDFDGKRLDWAWSKICYCDGIDSVTCYTFQGDFFRNG